MNITEKKIVHEIFSSRLYFSENSPFIYSNECIRLFPAFIHRMSTEGADSSSNNQTISIFNLAAKVNELKLNLVTNKQNQILQQSNNNIMEN